MCQRYLVLEMWKHTLPQSLAARFPSHIIAREDSSTTVIRQIRHLIEILITVGCVDIQAHRSAAEVGNSRAGELSSKVNFRTFRTQSKTILVRRDGQNGSDHDPRSCRSTLFCKAFFALARFFSAANFSALPRAETQLSPPTAI